jgi:MFS family permease
MINDRIDKKAAEKNEKSMAGLTAATNTAADGKAPAAPFDIAKYAGIFAAVGMAIGLIGAALAGVVAALKGITWWQALIIIAVVLLLISGPSMFIAWRKLRKRDVGPILNANGWAINAKALVRVKFGKTLTSLAEFPKLTAVDEKARKAQARRRFWGWFCGIVIVAAVALWLCNVLAPIGVKSPLKCYNPDPVEEVVEDVTPAEASVIPGEAEETPAAEAAPAE